MKTAILSPEKTEMDVMYENDHKSIALKFL